VVNDTLCGCSGGRGVAVGSDNHHGGWVSALKSYGSTRRLVYRGRSTAGNYSLSKLCVGIVDIFLDSRVPNLHNPLPPFINVPNSSCHLQKIDNIQQLYNTMSRLIVVLGAIAQSLPLMPNTVISANGSNHMFPASDCPYIVTPPPYIPLAPPEPHTTSIYNPHQVPNNTQNPAPITKPLPTTLPTLTLPKVSMFLTFSLHTTQHPV